MSRGSAQAAQNQLNTTNQNAAQQQQQATQLENTLIPTYTSMLTGQGPAMNAAMGATASSYDAANQQAQQKAAQTGNAAALPATEDQLALNKGQAMGSTAANTAGQLQQEGAQGLQSLYGENQNTANSMYGLGPSTINAWSTAAQNPYLGLATGLIGAAGQAGGAAITKYCWIARAIYGDTDPRPELLARIWWERWIGRSYAARVLMAIYLVIGEPVGWVAKNWKVAKRILAPVFDRAVAKALRELKVIREADEAPPPITHDRVIHAYRSNFTGAFHAE